MEVKTMEEEKNNIGTEDKQENVDKFKDKKNAFTMTYILVGITIIAILGLLVYALIVSNYDSKTKGHAFVSLLFKLLH